jgi:Uma2 family endonuclease
MGKTKLYLTHEDQGLRLTREEFANADTEEPWRYERANGSLVVMTPRGYEHHRVTKYFRNHLGAYELAHPEVVEDVFQECWSSIDSLTDRIADIAVYLRSSAGKKKQPDRVPDVIFEIVSAGPHNRRRDYEEKRDDYGRFGVREYVIVDGFQHTVTVLRLSESGYEESSLGADDAYTSPLLPGLEIRLKDVL